MAYCYVVTGTRGSGKGAFSVASIKDALANQNRIATNMLLFMHELGDDETHYDVTRLPDFPTGDHLYQLGKAYDFDPNKPETINTDKEGLLLLDEASLYLNSARAKDFDSLVKYLVLSRKLGWNILIICQNKDQLQDTIYKSLADKLIVCRDNVNFRVPYLSKLLENLGLQSLIKDSHSAFVFSGRSELDALEKEIKFKNRPHRLCYSTAQLFSDQTEYLGNSFVDMRANYTYLPLLYLSGNYYIQKLNNLKQSIITTYQEKEIDDMVSSKGQGLSTGEKIKAVLLIVGVIAFVYFQNPMDNKIVKDMLDQPEQGQPLPQVSSVLPQQVIPQQQVQVIAPVVAAVAPISRDDFVRALFRNYRPNLTAYMNSPTMGVSVVIDFYKSSALYERLTLDDFHIHGYSVTPSGDAVIIRGDDFNKRVTTWFHGQGSVTGEIDVVENNNAEIAARLQ